MIEVRKRETGKIAIFYKNLRNEEIQDLILNSLGWVQSGYINDQETLFIKTGGYKIVGALKEDKYTSVAVNNWLVMDAMAAENNKLLINKIKVVHPEEFDEMYEIIRNEADLFSGLEEDEEKYIKFENIKKKKA